MAGEQQRHHLVADLQVAEPVSLLILGVEQQAEDVAPAPARAAPLGDLRVDELVELARGGLHARPGRPGPAEDAHAEPELASNVTWLQVIPDSWVDDPAAVVTSRESIRLALIASLPAHPGSAGLVWRMMLCGAGFGFFQSPNLKAIMSSAPPERSGGASGIVATSRLVGQAVGAALVALCFGLSMQHGPALALALGAGFAGAGSLVSFSRLTTRPVAMAAPDRVKQMR